MAKQAIISEDRLAQLFQECGYELRTIETSARKGNNCRRIRFELDDGMRGHIDFNGSDQPTSDIDYRKIIRHAVQRSRRALQSPNSP